MMAARRIRKGTTPPSHPGSRCFRTAPISGAVRPGSGSR